MSKLVVPELTFGFLTACLPVLPRFLKHVFHIRGFWTSSPATGTGQSCAAISATNGKGSRITKVIDTDIEFTQLTSMESRSNSLHTCDTWGHNTGIPMHEQHVAHGKWHGNATLVGKAY